ncbi:MAG: hypothetical protein Q4D22_01110 [Candidatus Saccharibacteria bacterium]|jgi:hypothetical protein|nr:hypothetical protein [Candidatus Saccharibacteria bacterium]
MDKSLIAFLVAVIAVGILLFVAISISKKRGPSFNKEDYQVDFLRIENALTDGNEQSYSMAIINGDKLLDKALCEMGVPGRTMGDRLKKIGKEKFSQLNAVWHAHKLRNQIAHEQDFQPTYAQASHALETYKQALKDLGAI